MIQIKIELPLIRSSNDTYAGLHWNVRKRDKETFLDEFWVHKGKIRPVEEYPVRIDFFFYFEKRVYDPSNCSYMGKILEDCLVAIGVLKDDRRKYVQGVYYQSDKSCDKINYVIIKIKKGDKQNGKG